MGVLSFNILKLGIIIFFFSFLVIFLMFILRYVCRKIFILVFFMFCCELLLRFLGFEL